MSRVGRDADPTVLFRLCLCASVVTLKLDLSPEFNQSHLRRLACVSALRVQTCLLKRVTHSRCVTSKEEKDEQENSGSDYR